MLEAKLWHIKTEIKNVKVAKMVKFVKTCEQYPHVKFCQFFQFHNPPPPLSAGKKNRSSENAVQKDWVISFWLVEGGGVIIKTWGRVFLGA